MKNKLKQLIALENNFINAMMLQCEVHQDIINLIDINLATIDKINQLSESQIENEIKLIEETGLI